MMTKKKTSRMLGAKFAWALPAIALLLFAFAEPSYEVKAVQSENPVSVIQKGEKEFTIHGKVIEEKTKEPLPGASIVIKGSTVGTVSDMDGTFKLVDPNPKVESKGYFSEIVVSFVGFKTRETTVSSIDNKLEIEIPPIKMEDAVILIENDTYIGEIPPPPPPKVEKNNVPPPPPPSSPLKKGEKEQEVFYIVEDLPKYPGGHAALKEYVANMQHKQAQAKGIKGKAKVAFTVNGKGKVTDVKIVEQDNEGVAKGAVAIVSGLEDWTPGKQRGKAVPVKYLLPVEFK